VRVAVVTENFLPKLDGVTRTLAMLLEFLQRRGDRAVLFGPEGGPRRYAGARVFGVPGIPLPIYPELRMLFPPADLTRRLALFRPDVVHVADPMLLGAAGIFAGARLGVPVVASYHTNLAAYCKYFGLRALEAPVWRYRRYLHSQASATLCPSPSTALELEQWGFPRVRVWSRGVDADLFAPKQRSEEWRRQVAGDPNKTIVLYVGRLSYEKNLGALMAAHAALRREDVQLVLVGDGPARASLERAVGGERVTLTGYLRGKELARAYASADVFAFPSLTETFGQVVQEAMASGLPVVGFAAQGVRDLVRDGATGILAAPGDTAAFTAALSRLVDDETHRRALGEQARALAQQRTWDRVMESLVDVYAEIIDSVRARPAA
jgi:glycosyltransferase involved in cell wall biosynthesis